MEEAIDAVELRKSSGGVKFAPRIWIDGRKNSPLQLQNHFRRPAKGEGIISQNRSSRGERKRGLTNSIVGSKHLCCDGIRGNLRIRDSEKSGEMAASHSYVLNPVPSHATLGGGLPCRLSVIWPGDEGAALYNSGLSSHLAIAVQYWRCWVQLADTTNTLGSFASESDQKGSRFEQFFHPHQKSVSIPVGATSAGVAYVRI
jgi:hypothetical protein